MFESHTFRKIEEKYLLWVYLKTGKYEIYYDDDKIELWHIAEKYLWDDMVRYQVVNNATGFVVCTDGKMTEAWDDMEMDI